MACRQNGYAAVCQYIPGQSGTPRQALSRYGRRGLPGPAQGRVENRQGESAGQALGERLAAAMGRQRIFGGRKSQLENRSSGDYRAAGWPP